MDQTDQDSHGNNTPEVKIAQLLRSNARLIVERAQLQEKLREMSAVQKQMEEAVHEREEHYRRFFEENLSGHFISTPDGTLLACNPAFARIFGFSSVEEALRRNLNSLYPDPQSREQFVELIKKEKRLNHHEGELRRCDGKPVYVIEKVIGTFNAHGELVEIKGYVFDNTERKQLEEQLLHAQKIEAVGRLAGGVSHDFNNLLTGIIGYTELLSELVEPQSEAGSKILEIRKLADRAAKLTSQLLAFSRRQVLKPQVLNLNQLIDNTVQMLVRLIGEAIELRFIPASDLDTIRADASQIEHVLMNLAVNARDSMPNGGTLIIETANVLLGEEHEVPAGPYVMIAVTDSGCGMDAETRQRIFEPFFTTKPTGKGTGLGLSTAYGIVKQHNGHIAVYSAVGRGSTFKVYLPRADGCTQEVSVRKAQAPAPRGCETVLVVEDESAVRAFVQTVLERQGYTAFSASHPEQAEKLFQEKKDQIELLLADVVLPGCDGRELFDRLLRIKPGLKVLFMSGYTDNALIHQGVLTADLPFLQKPFMPRTLAAKVRQVLDGATLNTVSVHIPGKSCA